MTSWRIQTPGNHFNENWKDTGAWESADIGSSIALMMTDLKSSRSARESQSMRKWHATLFQSAEVSETSHAEHEQPQFGSTVLRMRTMAATERSTSPSVVDQFETEIRM